MLSEMIVITSVAAAAAANTAYVSDGDAVGHGHCSLHISIVFFD